MKQGQLIEIINESLKLNESVDTGMEYWYYTKHGIGPGAIPKGVTVLDTVETDDWGTYVLLDKMLTTKELEDYEIKEQVPSEDEMNKARNSANKSLTESFEIYFSDLNDEAQQNLLDYMGVENASDMNWDIDMAPIAIYESLTEARNPENDEINAAIKRYLSSDKAYIPKKDRELFDKYGITPGKFSRKYGSEKYLHGSNDRVIGQDFLYNVHQDYDFANLLTKEQIDGADKEIPSKDMLRYRYMFGGGPIASENDDSVVSNNQFDSLQPYASEKEQIKAIQDRRNKALRDEEEKIKAIKKDADRDKEDIMNSVRAKRASKDED